jgi:cell division protein FtsI/penicillin-binding protein 2
MAAVVAGDQSAAETEIAAFWGELEVADANVAIGDVGVGNDSNQSWSLDVTMELDRLGAWSYPTEVQVTQNADQWAVVWSPASLHPALIEGRRLQRLRLWPERGELLAQDGTALRTDVAVVDVGLEPQRIQDQDQTLAALSALLDVDADDVETNLNAPGVQPDWFVPVKQLRQDEYEALAPALSNVPGVITKEGTDRLGPTNGYAAQMLGATGPITAEQLQQWGEPYDVSSIVGRSGLELTYEAELAGTPTGEIRLLEADGQLISVLQRFAGVPPRNVQVTIDKATQAAAEATLDGVSQPAALVAIDTATGEVRAMVSRPADEFGRASGGAYPPGSTFKTITATAYLDTGATPATSVQCPAEVNAGGFVFSNAGGAALGTVSLQTAYAASCNTAFVNVSEELSNEQLISAAEVFGFGVDYRTGVTTVGGAVPTPVDAAERGAAAIGQGRVTASPLHMASVAAAVSSGTWRAPVLVLEPQPESAAPSIALDPDIAGSLRDMMRAVVTSGTGTAAASAGGDISGKTGSAEFGDDDPPQTHAWFIGYRDGLAVAVLVEGGGGGGSVAAPLAAAFYSALDS